MKFIEKQKYSYKELANCIRVLASDGVEKARSGHPGMVLGIADVMTILCFNFLKFNPNDPTWFNRDRLILSAGHGSMLLYSFYYLAEYLDFTLDDVKNFRQLHSKTPGHPEYGAYKAIETSTGPLGQGFGNAVGMAIAQKKYEQYLGREICDYKIYCVVGDGCLMEGISYESASIAGHLNLNNLIVIFDDNKISIDGPTNLTVSEDHLAKFVALGWNVEQIDGHNFDQIHDSLTRAQKSDKPYFIACRTTIAKGSVNKAGSEKSHGSPLGKDEISLLKANLQVKNEEFYIATELKEIWKNAWIRNKELYIKWQEDYCNLDKNLQFYIKKPTISNHILDNFVSTTESEATRTSSGKIIERLISNLNHKFICGSADLSLSTNIKSLGSRIISKDDFSGHFIHYGVRENAMGSIMNGLSLSGFIPIGGTFFVFSDYMKPSIRLSAIMNQQVIYVMTHDSIGVGEDGPTHQPIEHLASMRSMPNSLTFRPADSVETMECWQLALTNTNRPSILALTRQSVPQITNIRQNNLCAKGAYVISEDDDSILDVIIFATGSECSIGIEVKEKLNERNIMVRLVSVPCFELFFEQDNEYIDYILGVSKLKVAIEAGSSFGWHRFIGHEGLFCGIGSFGLSAPAIDLYKYFELDSSIITDKIIKRLMK